MLLPLTSGGEDDRHLSEAELAQLTLAVVNVNGWSRSNVSFHTPAGNYSSRIRPSAQ
jgi:hypothetical protein